MRLLSLGNSVIVSQQFGAKTRIFMRVSGTFVLGLCDDPAVKEAERLAMHQDTKERGYTCSTSLSHIRYLVRVMK